MKLTANTLKEFRRYGRNIKPNNLLTIYGYVRLTISKKLGMLTKTNSGVYMSYTFDTTEPDCDIIIDESVLNKFNNDVSIRVEDNQCFITDGEYEEEYAFENVINFSSFDTITCDISLGEIVMESIQVASKYTDKDINRWDSCVHLNEHGILGMTQFYCYHMDIPELPSIILDKNAALTLSELPTCHFGSNETMYFFKHDNVMYGIIKHASFSTPNYISHIKNIDKSGGCIVNAKAIAEYCKRTLSMNEADIICHVSTSGNTLIFTSLGSKKNKFTLPYSGEHIKGEFSPATWLTAFSNLPYEKVHIKEGARNFSIFATDDPLYTGFVAKTVIL